MGISSSGHGGYPNGSCKGRSYLIYGDPNLNGAISLAGADAIFEGENNNDCSGVSVACAGDVNGDGYSDLLIGASGASKAYLIYGCQSLSLAQIGLADSDVIFLGEATAHAAGRCVAGVGDVNGDGYGDILIGAPYNNANGTYTGKCYLIYGSPTLSGTQNLSQANASFTGEASYNYAGYRVSMAGDVNGDYYDDLFISAYGNSQGGHTRQGKCYLIYGSPTLSGAQNLSQADVSFIGEESNDYAGQSISYAGDVNDDGLSDLLIGAPNNDDPNRVYRGAAYLIFGNSSLSGENDLSETGTTLAGATLSGENSYDQAGFCVAYAGDVNNDGYGDIMVGAPFRTNGSLSMSGKVYFIFGSNSLSGDHSLSDADASLAGEAAYDRFGYALSHAGMLLGEGSNLSLIAAPYNNGYRGKSSLYITKANTSPAPIQSVNITESFIWFGQTLHLELTGTDADPNSRDVALVAVTTQSDPHGIMIRLIETGENTGIFQGEVDVYYTGSNPFSKRIMASIGDTITVKSVDDPTKQATIGVPVPVINVTCIIFDHTLGEASDGVNIRFNNGEDITPPEWEKDVRNHPVCYIKGKTVTIKAKFSVSPDIVSSARISADSINSNGCLGDVQEALVTFTSGYSDYVEFQISGTTPSAIKKATDEWQWYFRDVDVSGSTERAANISGPHTIYTILGAPQSPMAEPWTNALDYACNWASGKNTEQGALEKITQGAYSGLNKHYYGGNTHAQDTTFNLTKFLNENWGDCRDISAVAHVFTRAIGGTPRCRRIDGPFWYKPILPFGWLSPDYSGGPWNFHQVAVRGDAQDNVYDSCIKLNIYEQWVIPIAMSINGNYKYYLYWGTYGQYGGWWPQTPFDYITIL